MKTVPTYVSELPEDYQNLYGLWKVTTEGDEEGRTTKSLGIYEGWVDEIALYLSDKCYYSLTFTAYHINKVPVSSNYIKKDKAQVNVKFDIDSKTWDLSAHDRAQLISNLFAANNRVNVKIEEGGTYAGFVVSNYTEAEIQERRRQKALAKLTDEDKLVLGLLDQKDYYPF